MQFTNGEIKRRNPITRNNMFCSEEDFKYEMMLATDYIEQDMGQTIVLYEVDLENTQVDDIYKEAKKDNIHFKTPIELPVVYELEDAQLKEYDKSQQRGVYVKMGKLTFSVLEKTLEENQCDIKRGDYIGLQVTPERMEFFTVVDDGRINYSNKQSYYGRKPYFRKISAAPVDKTNSTVNMLPRTNIRKNITLRDDPDPKQEQMNLVKEILKDSTFMPKTLSYKDIDEAFLKWAENEIQITFEDKNLPTYAFFSSQKYNEFMQTWEDTDEMRNMRVNMKIVSRENNPKFGTIRGKLYNVPTKTKYLMKRIEALDDTGKKCYVDFRMAQPKSVDLTYKLMIITNKYELLNIFNTKIQDKFKSCQSYIFPNDHPIAMKLNSISDESEYTVDDRQYFAQTVEIIVQGYIIDETDYETVVVPMVSTVCLGENNGKKKVRVEIDDVPENICEMNPEKTILPQATDLSINFPPCSPDTVSFTIDCSFIIDEIKLNNIRSFVFKDNDEPIDDVIGFKMDELDKIKIKAIKVNSNKEANIVFIGHNPDIILDSHNDIKESALDETNKKVEIEIV